METKYKVAIVLALVLVLILIILAVSMTSGSSDTQESSTKDSPTETQKTPEPTPSQGCSGTSKFYEHGDYQGRVLGLSKGEYDYPFINDKGFNDVISSYKIAPGCKVTAYEHANKGGRKLDLTGDNPWIGNSLNDIVSGIFITDAEYFANL